MRVKGAVGEFELTLNNLNLAVLHDIRIYEDYFITKTLDNNSIQLNSIGIFSILPNTTIEELSPNKKVRFMISFKPTIEQMKEFYVDRKGLHMRILRLTIKYKRKLDGKEYKKTKAYLIAGHGDYLIDSDDRGMTTPDMISFNDVKNILGVENN